MDNGRTGGRAHYDTALDLGRSAQQKADLVAYLGML